jgi:hypothetical protein
VKVKGAFEMSDNDDDERRGGLIDCERSQSRGEVSVVKGRQFINFEINLETTLKTC